MCRDDTIPTGPLLLWLRKLPLFLLFLLAQLKLGVGLKMQENVTCGICSELSRCLNAPIEKDIRAGLGQWEDCSWEKDGLGHGQGVLHSNAWLYCSPAKARGSWKLIFLDTQLLILRAWAFIVAITPSHSSLLHTCLLFPINAGGWSHWLSLTLQFHSCKNTRLFSHILKVSQTSNSSIQIA